MKLLCLAYGDEAGWNCGSEREPAKLNSDSGCDASRAIFENVR